VISQVHAPPGLFRMSLSPLFLQVGRSLAGSKIDDRSVEAG
jgi:hypothetical protein